MPEEYPLSLESGLRLLLQKVDALTQKVDAMSALTERLAASLADISLQLKIFIQSQADPSTLTGQIKALTELTTAQKDQLDKLQAEVSSDANTIKEGNDKIAALQATVDAFPAQLQSALNKDEADDNSALQPLVDLADQLDAQAKALNPSVVIPTVPTEPDPTPAPTEDVPPTTTDGTVPPETSGENTVVPNKDAVNTDPSDDMPADTTSVPS